MASVGCLGWVGGGGGGGEHKGPAQRTGNKMAGHQRRLDPPRWPMTIGRRRCTERRHACGDARSGVRVPVALVAWRWRHIGGCHRTGQDVLASCTTAAPPQERTIGRPYPTYYYAAADAIDWLKDTPSSRLFDRGPCLQGVGSLARCVARLGWLTGWIMSASKRARQVGACPAAVARVARHHRRSRHLCSSGNVEPKDPFRNGTLLVCASGGTATISQGDTLRGTNATCCV